MSVIVTVTRPSVTITASPTSPPESTVSAGVITGIVVGTLVGGLLLITLVLYLYTRFGRHTFTRVANPALDRVSATAGTPDIRYFHKSGSKHVARHSQRPSISTEPLISPVSWPPLPSALRAQSPGTPPHSLTSKASYRPATTHTLDIPLREPEHVLPASGAPHVRQPSGDDTTSITGSQRSNHNLFIYRLLQSRASAPDEVSTTHRLSLDFSQSRCTTPRAHVDQEQFLVDAERDRERIGSMEEEDWDDTRTVESTYSQLSAPIDHSSFFSGPVSAPNSSLSLPRRKSSRKHSRAPAPPTDLPPVAEVSDSSTSFEGRSQSRSILTAANSSLDAQVSHGTASRPLSSVMDQPGTLPLLTSVNFGKESATSGTPPGSMSSSTGWASSSNGRTSRYPSLAPSSVGQSSRSGPRSDAGSTDWHHPPSGLAGLATLQIGSLANPHSPVEEQPELPVPPRPPGKHARLREGTTGSLPEVERRTVVQGGIAHIEVALD